MAMDREHEESDLRKDDGHTVLEATPARQGIITGRVRYVLIIGLALVVVAYAIIYLTGA